MKKREIFIRQLRRVNIVIVLFLCLACRNVTSSDDENQGRIENKKAQETFWHVKAIHPEGNFLDIKAIDGFGNTFDVRAIQNGNQMSLMDVKAYVSGKILPIKILVNDGKLAPVKAIAKDGSIYNIKAILPNGNRLNIKGVRRSGNIIDIKAVDDNGQQYGVKAISSRGKLHDIKGIKIRKEDLEYTIYGSPIYAHVKALPQTGDVGNNFLWHIVAIHPEGSSLEVKAMDSKGNLYDVKAIQDANQRSLLDVKTFVGKTDQLPVKIMSSDDLNKPVVAIGKGGEIYDLIVISENGDRLDIKGIPRSKNLLDIKVLNTDGILYSIKAISPKGEMNDVKGIKLLGQEIEMKIQGVDIHAHVKALPQVSI